MSVLNPKNEQTEKIIHLMITDKCKRNCKYCCNKQYDVHKIPVVTHEELQKAEYVFLTGGEPLINANFLKQVLPDIKQKIYLETNGTLSNELKKIIDYIDIIAMDIKIPSATGNTDLFDEHEEFIKTAIKKELFIKVVFNEKITDEETDKILKLASKYNLPIILQPESNGNKIKNDIKIINKVFYKFRNQYKNVRLIPQVHKFLDAK